MIKEVCCEVFAFMLVVQPRRLISHQSAVVHGCQSVDALIVAGEQIQEEVGPPDPGTYRRRLLHRNRGPTIY